MCYGGDATDVAVYVGDMEENTVADVSGKIMVGDQIVQVRQEHQIRFLFWTLKAIITFFDEHKNWQKQKIGHK